MLLKHEGQTYKVLFSAARANQVYREYTSWNNSDSWNQIRNNKSGAILQDAF